MNTEIKQHLDRYFRGKLEEHGASARGVDWGSEERQRLCFSQVLKICRDPETMTWDRDFSLLDFGCGYGALTDYLARESVAIGQYTGYDLSTPMVEAARQQATALGDRSEFTDREPEDVTFDYVVACGVVALKLEADEATWKTHIEATIRKLWKLCRKGFSFNSLTRYSDADRMRPDLYYPDPCELFHFCKTELSRQVALLHDYGPYEFTILVRREED